MRRPRVLLIAEMCNPEWVSVPLEGWSHTQAIARRVDALIVTQVRNAGAMTRAGLVEGKDFVALDTEASARPIWSAAEKLRGGQGKGWTTLAALSGLMYYFFERALWKRFGAEIRDGAFDLVHRVTPLSPTTPSLLAGKCAKAGVPFLLGPLNGGVPWPPGFERERRMEKEWLSYVRGLYRLMPGHTSTRRHASAIIAGSRDTLEQVPAQFRSKCFYIPENAIDPARFTATRSRAAERPLRVAFVGRLVPYKGADMLLEACAPLVRQGQVVVEIIGDGPEAPRLREIIRRERMEAGASMPGWVKHTELQHRLAQNDVFGFPSVREFGGAVALEAMAVGLLPVVVGYGGPAELVTDRTGVRVPIGSREAIIAGVREALTTLAQDPARVDRMARAALRRARERFTWDAKAAQVVQVYEWTLDPSSPRPDFPIPIPDAEDAPAARPAPARITPEPAAR